MKIRFLLTNLFYWVLASSAWAGLSAPSFLSITPNSPSSTTNNPLVKGEAGPEGASVHLYSDANCSSQIGFGPSSQFTKTGIVVWIKSDATTTIFAKTLDSKSGSASTCEKMTSFTHDSTPPKAPTFVSTVPLSPSGATTNPAVKGTASPDTATLTLYSDAVCTNSIGSGGREAFTGQGINVLGTANGTTNIYAKAFDGSMNGSPCTFLTQFVHDSTGPEAPTFVAAIPRSPTRETTEPLIVGTGTADTETINLYSDRLCFNQIGSGSKVAFAAAGIPAKIRKNSTIEIFARAYDQLKNPSPCVNLTTFIHDNIGPSMPDFSSITASMEGPDSGPIIQGKASPDTETMVFYNDPDCSHSIGTGKREDFISTGIAISASATTTPIYAVAMDRANNPSACVLLIEYPRPQKKKSLHITTIMKNDKGNDTDNYRSSGIKMDP